MKSKFNNRYTVWTYVNLRNGAQLCANKRNNIIHISYFDDYGEHVGGTFKCTKNVSARNTLIKLAKKMSYNDYFQFEWELKRLVETSH